METAGHTLPYSIFDIYGKHNIQQINLQVTYLKHFPCIDSEPCIFIGNLAVEMYRNSIHVNLVIILSTLSLFNFSGTM